jgi:hypothetical protein
MGNKKHSIQAKRNMSIKRLGFDIYAEIYNILDLREKGVTNVQIAEKYGCTRNCITKLLRKYRNGELNDIK